MRFSYRPRINARRLLARCIGVDGYQQYPSDNTSLHTNCFSDHSDTRRLRLLAARRFT